MTASPKRPRDPNQLAKLIVDIATNEDTSTAMPENKAMLAKGRAGGLVGGKARAAALAADERTKIAQKAAHARWQKKDIIPS